MKDIKLVSFETDGDDLVWLFCDFKSKTAHIMISSCGDLIETEIPFSFIDLNAH